MEHEKFLIVSIDHEDYSAHIRHRKLEPGACFQCLTEAEAMTAVDRNLEWGITPTVMYTAKWRKQHSSLQRARAVHGVIIEREAV